MRHYLAIRRARLTLIVLAVALVTWRAPAQLILSEIMAANNGGLLDQDGDASDWIEIQNTGAAAVNLAGWKLTDDATSLGKWTFPATNLGPGAFLLVFASGKNRATPGGKLHTNFELDSAGEYLALVRPDGVTVEFEFAPAFPPQQENVSYGTARMDTTTSFVSDGKSAKWRVPSAAAGLPADWAGTNYDDSAWSGGLVPMGFDAGQVTGGAGGAITNVARGKTATQSSTLSTFTPNLAVDGDLADFTHTAGGQGLPATWEVNLATNAGIERIVIQNRTSCCGSRLRDITARILSLDGTATNFTSALLNPENTGYIYPNGPANLTVNLTNLTGGLVFGGRVRITRTPDPDLSGTGGQGNADEADVLSLAEVEVYAATAPLTFDFIVRTDLEAAMRNINASAFVRVPFLVVQEELPALDSFTLRMKYDDGFAAYLNGVKVAEANAPTTPAWNWAATAEHADTAALQFESFDLTAYSGLLQEGINVLAIQGLNRTAADDDFLLGPELSGLSRGTVTAQYFTQPTPGATNTVGTMGLVADTKFSVDRGFFDVPFAVAITCATAGAEIRYTTNGSAPGVATGVPYAGPILISRTTVLRAIATKPGWTPSDVDTHTYVFLSNVVVQSHSSVTNAGYPNTWAGVAADYAMDPRITTSSNAPLMIPALRSLPSVFFSTSISNLFDATTGIYSQPTTHGTAWERPVSMEMVDTNGATEFQEDCGLRIQGGYFRDANVTQKHSFRVLFKAQYGAGKLRHNLFKSDNALQEFDTLVLRAGANDGYSWNEAKDTEQFTRDEFGRGVHQAMGHPAPHGVFVHLYLNGVYWGLYNIVERPNEDFSASYFGDDPLEWDSNNAGDIKNGDLQAWNAFNSQTAAATTTAAYERVQGNNPDGSRNSTFPVYLDRFNYIDYMIANIWGGNWDWPNKNFWFGRLRTADSTGFKFYMWDFENTMGNNRARSPLNMVSPRAGLESSWVAQPHFYLKNLAEYRIDFADRVQRYFFDIGALTPGVLTNRYRALADLVELSILAETARWGDDNLNPPQDIEDWRRERDWILGTYLPQRSAVVLQQFRAAGLFPSLSAPQFSQPGGTVPEGYNLELTHTNVSGVIYLTTDGSDPRLIGGALSPFAQGYSLPISITTPIFIRARVLNGTNWSPIIEGVFQPPQDLSKLLITEIMYNPLAAGLVDGDEFEFVELKNTSATTLNLSNLRFTGGIAYNFTNGTFLGAGEFFLIVRNAAQFAAKYPGMAIGGVYSGSLNNAGENLRLTAVLGGTVQSVDYDDRAPWPAAADGFGFSLVPVNPNANPDPDRASNWRVSTLSGGSPGADDPPPANIPTVLINEALTATALPDVDKIELFNPTAEVVDIGGWFLTDEPDTPAKYRIPPGTMIQPGDYLTFDESQFNAAPGASNSFSLRAEGDDVYLFSADANGNLTGYSHGFSVGAAAPGVTFGRHVNSLGEEDFTAQVAATLGGTNSGPRIGPVVINEIMYHPQSGADEFIELRNISGASIELFDPVAPTNTWRLNGLGLNFPTNLTLASDGLLLIVSSDPVAFRAKYSIPAAVPILGPYAGTLQDSGERLELQRPGLFDTNSRVAYITVDMVRYNDKAPWPPAADGSGPSLQRENPFAYGNEPLNWEAAVATPGRVFAGGTPPTITLQPAGVSAVATREAMFAVGATGPGPLFYQWRFNGVPLPGATNTTLFLTNLQLTQAGSYGVLVFNEAGSAESAPAVLTILVAASITTNPTNTSVRIKPDPLALPATNTAFYAQATSTTPIRYQWQKFDGAAFVSLAGATGSTLIVTNVQLADGGDYRCAITDNVGTVFTQPARLIPLITPTIFQGPLSQTAAPGGSVSVSVALGDGNPAPFWYEWRRGSTIIGGTNNGTKYNVFNFLAHTNIAAQQYRLVVTNLAVTNLQAVTRTFTITTLADTDGDGIFDEWENAYALNPASAADRNQDTDGDGLSNWQEYQAGTDPRNPASYLRIQLAATPGLAQIEFNAASNKTYSVQFTEGLGAGPWRRLADVLAATNNRVEFVLDAEWTSNRVYRLVTPQQP